MPRSIMAVAPFSGSMGLIRFLRWWWPSFTFIYPLLYYPSGPNSNVLQDGYWVRSLVLIVFVGVGLVVEWMLHPHLRLADISKLPRFLRLHPPVGLALGFGVWALIVAQFALEPNSALLGSLFGSGEGALFVFGLSALFVLVYLALQRDIQLAGRVVVALVASGVLIGVLALVEVGLGSGLFFSIGPSDVPMVTFPQKGHLAGYFALMAGVIVGLIYRSGHLLWLASGLLLLSLALGTTTNRAALVGLAVVVLLGIKLPRRMLLVGTVMGLGFFLGYGWLQLQTAGASRQLSNSTSSSLRLYYWKAAIRGILERPLFGWGAAGFEQVWPQYLSRSDFSTVARLEFGVKELLSYSVTPGAQPILIVKNQQGERQITSVSLWKAHNQYLDLALLRGIPALLLYLGLLLWILLATRWNPATYGVVAYHLFLLLWFAPFHIEGSLWVLLALAARPAKEPHGPTAPTAIPPAADAKVQPG